MAEPTSAPGPGRRGITWSLLAGVVLLPLMVRTAWTDPFARPKAILLVGVVGVAVVAAAVSAATGTLPRLRWRGLDMALGLFVVFSAVATLTAADPWRSFAGQWFQYQGLAALVCYVLSFYLARLAFRSVAELHMLFAAVTVAATAVAGYAVLQKLGVDPLWDELPQGRAFASVGDPNALAAYLVVALPAAAALVVSGPVWLRMPAAAGGWIVAVGLAVTFSRGGYLGIAAAAATFVLFGVGSAAISPRGVAYGAAAVAVVAVGALVLFQPARTLASAVFDRALSTVDSTDFSIKQRVSLWEVGVEIARDHPLAGTGPDSFRDVFPAYRDEVLDPDEAAVFFDQIPSSPHNLLITTAQGSGIPALAGLVAGVTAMFALVAEALPRRPDRAGRLALAAVLAAASGYLVTAMFMTTELTGSWTFWVVAGAGVGVASSPGRGREPGPSVTGSA